MFHTMVLSLPTSPAGAHIHKRTSDYTLASYQNLTIIIWHDRATMEAVQALSDAHRELYRAWPHGLFSLAIVEEQAIPPNAEVRAGLASFLKETQGLLACACILDGTGFRISVVRSVATSLTLLARQAIPFRVCSMNDAAELFRQEADKAGTHVDAEGLPGVMADLRRTIAAMD